MSLVFGKYEKIRRIAQGGMGEVFLARQTGVLDRLAILKSLRADLAQEREFVEQFLDEARVAATLNHPNIVSIYDVGEFNGTYYIAMEYVPGEDLSKLWYAAAKAGVGLPFQVSVRICLEAALALDHAHKAKDVHGSALCIVHRDVSPQNIMVRGDGVVKLVDFGIAKAANKSSRTQTGMVKGKLQYMSPEQVRGEPLDGRSDQFSLGVVLWEMCTGRRLFKADTEINTLQKILQSPIPKPAEHVPGFPPELESTILKMLQRDVEKRFRTVGDVAADLKGYLDRASLTSGETSVAGFVQQILGKELEDRVKDLTPMEPTEHGVLPPQKPREPSGMRQKAQTSSRLAAQVAPNDGPTQVLNSDDDIGAIPTSPPGEFAVRKLDGSVMHFGEMSTLHQWILDGQVAADDSFSPDGKSWKKLSQAPQFQKFIEIAAAAKQVANAGPRTAPQTSGKTVTRPLPPAREQGADPNNPETISLSLQPSDPTDPMTGAFSLGDLPMSQTGTWGAPEIAMAVANAKASAHKENKELDGLTPTTRSGNTLPMEIVRKGVPTAVWMLGGIVVALALVVGGLAAFEPDVLRTLVASSDSGTEVLKALTAAKGDDASAIDALLKTNEPADADAGHAPVDVMAAGAILHVARARIDDETDRLAQMLGDPKVAPVTDAEGHRIAAYKLATKAIAGDKSSAGAQLAMASYQAERGALPELDTNADAALAAAKGTTMGGAVVSEVAVLRALIDAKAALSQTTDAAPVRSAADKLAAVDDPRARSLLPLLHARAAMNATDDNLRADVAKFKEAARAVAENAGTDPRAAVMTALAKKLDKLAEAQLKKAPAVSVDAGVAVKNPATTTTNPSNPTGAPDAGVAVAPPPPPETYESAMQKARRAQQDGKAKAAAQYAKKALELKPGSTEAQIVLGYAYVDQNAYGTAIQMFRGVLERDPKSCVAQIGVATALDQQQKTTDARVEYLKFIEMCPGAKEVEMAKSAAARLE